MTKHYKFQVKVNDKCYKFREMKDICEFLGVSYGTLYNLRRNRLKCKHYTKSHLKDITITKIDYDKTHYKKKKEPLIKAQEYHQKLDDSYKLVISQDPDVHESST